MAIDPGSGSRIDEFKAGFVRGYFKNLQSERRPFRPIGQFILMVTAILFSLKFSGLTEISWWRVFQPLLVLFLFVIVVGFVAVIAAVSSEDEKP